ncbi:MAG: hypothetical protein KIS62_19975 [Ramlibacter sp.]|nr:hypothetical protein [Ramlibacter sp.]
MQKPVSLPGTPVRSAPVAPRTPARFALWPSRAASPVARPVPVMDLRDLDQRVRETGEW